MREVAAVLNRKRKPIYFHLPSGRSSWHIPDDRGLWEVLWENRKILGGVVHTHPGYGFPAPSYEDVTTFAAVEAALGKRLTWTIVNEDEVQDYHWVGPGRLDYEMDGTRIGRNLIKKIWELSQQEGENGRRERPHDAASDG